MKLFKIPDYESFLTLKTDMANEINALGELEQSLNKQLKNTNKIYYAGFSWPVQQTTKFLIDNQYSLTEEINFRERLVCQKTKLNNRVRGAIHVFEELFCPKLNDEIYITEQHTLLYQWLKNKYSNIVGSEYMTASSYLNKLRFQLKLFPQKLNHQDLTCLTYAENRFKYILSFDCFEHIPNYQKALSEIHRVLKADGTLLLSVPFDLHAKETLVRASINQNGTTTFHVEPEYHGNPVSKKGSLSYYTFGWDLLGLLSEIGYKEVYALIYWSTKYAYLGGEQLLISAKK